MSYRYPKSDPANCHGYIVSEDSNTVTYRIKGKKKTVKKDADFSMFVRVKDDKAGWLNLWRGREENKGQRQERR